MKTNGLAFLIEIHNEHQQRAISTNSLEKYLNEFKIYMDRARNCLSDVRISLVVDNSDVALRVDQADISFLAHSLYPNCIDVALGICSQNRMLGVVFGGDL